MQLAVSVFVSFRCIGVLNGMWGMKHQHSMTKYADVRGHARNYLPVLYVSVAF